MNDPNLEWRAARLGGNWGVLAFGLLLVACCQCSAQGKHSPLEQGKGIVFRTGRYHCELDGTFDVTLDLKTNGTYQLSEKLRKGQILQSGDWKRSRDEIVLTRKSPPKAKASGYDFSRFYIDDRFPDTLRWGGRGMDYLAFKRVESEE